MDKTEKLAFLGIGLMGNPMVKNLLSAGYAVNVWNRSKEKAQALEQYSATVASTIAQAVAQADIIISMVSDGTVTQSLISEPDVQASLTKGAVWVDMSSTRPDDAKSVAQVLAGVEVGFVDAPVSGGTRGAENATLAIMAGANKQNFDRVFPVLSYLGRPVHVGEVGAGQLAKLANQLIVGSSIGAVAEAILLLEKGGANSKAVLDALKGGFADSSVLQQHGLRMITPDFAPGAPSRLQLKDLDNVLLEAQATGLNLPMTQQTRDRFARYVTDLEGAEKDHSGLYEELLDLNVGAIDS